MTLALTPPPRPRAGVASPLPPTLALAVALLGACVEITTTTEVRTIPHPDRARAPVRARVVERREYAVSWVQTGDTLEVEVEARPRCRDVVDVPMLRETRTIRRADPALYAEYAIVALCGAVAAYAFARPESFSSPLLTADGQVIRDSSPGYTAAGVFTGVASFTLISAIRDSLRARDRVDYEDASERRDLGPAPCEGELAAPAPWAQRSVDLLVGEARLAALADDRGHARFRLPADPAHGALPPGSVVKAALRLDADHAVSLDLVVPYESTRLRPHRGEVTTASNPLASSPAEATRARETPRETSPMVGPPAAGERPASPADGGLIDTPLPPPEPEPPRARRPPQQPREQHDAP